MHAPSKKSPSLSHAARVLTEDKPGIRTQDRPDTIPRPASVPREALPSGYVGTLAEAPPWAIAVIEEMHHARHEFSIVMGEFADAAAALERQNREVIANQTSLRRAFDNLRSEFRSRVGAHDGEFGEVRARLESLEKEVAELNAMVDAIVRGE